MEEAKSKQEDIKRNQEEAERKQEEAKRKLEEVKRKQEEVERKQEEVERKQEEAKRKQEEAKRKQEDMLKKPRVIAQRTHAEETLSPETTLKNNLELSKPPCYTTLNKATRKRASPIPASANEPTTNKRFETNTIEPTIPNAVTDNPVSLGVKKVNRKGKQGARGNKHVSPRKKAKPTIRLPTAINRHTVTKNPRAARKNVTCLTYKVEYQNTYTFVIYMR